MPAHLCPVGICREADGAEPDYGYCAVHKAYYFGYKIHAACTPNGTIKTLDISNTSTHDIHYLNDLKTQLDHCVLVGDKGYLSRQYQDDLFDTAAIRLETPILKGHKCTATKLTLAIQPRVEKSLETHRNFILATL